MELTAGNMCEKHGENQVNYGSSHQIFKQLQYLPSSWHQVKSSGCSYFRSSPPSVHLPRSIRQWKPMEYLFCNKGISSIGHIHPTHTSNLLVECCIFIWSGQPPPHVPFPGSVKICQGFPSALTTDNCGVVHTHHHTSLAHGLRLSVIGDPPKYGWKKQSVWFESTNQLLMCLSPFLLIAGLVFDVYLLEFCFSENRLCKGCHQDWRTSDASSSLFCQPSHSDTKSTWVRFIRPNMGHGDTSTWCYWNTWYGGIIISMMHVKMRKIGTYADTGYLYFNWLFFFLFWFQLRASVPWVGSGPV